MPTKRAKSVKSARPRRSASKAKRTVARASGARAALRAAGKARKRFISDLLKRGEAAKPTAEGRLPLNATHVITGQEADGTAQVERVRFKTF